MSKAGVRSIDVRLWGAIIGLISLDESDTPYFEYNPHFKRLGIELSPFELPTETTTTFKQESVATTFRKLPGIIADCLPDRFGMRVISEFYKKKLNMEDHEINILQRLLYVGSRSIGGLEFYPSIGKEEILEDRYLEIQTLRAEARKLLDGKGDITTVDIMRVSGSAGGARAKALIDFNPVTKKIRSGFSKKEEGFIPALIKFDAAKEGEWPGFDGKLEYVYSQLANLMGIEMAPTYLLNDNEYAHFIVERFDRSVDGKKPYHYASLCGLLVRDFFQKHSCSYEEYFQVVLTLTLDMSQVLEAFKRAVFNIIFRNQDDHTKNFGFVMNRSGEWRVAPAFDLTYARDSYSASSHQMKFNFKDDHFEIDDFYVVGKKIGLRKKQISQILELAQKASQQFKKFCEECELEESFYEGIYKNFRLELIP